MKGKTFKTNYLTAAKWLHNEMVLCNNLPEVDESVLEDLYLWADDDEQLDVYQWFITDCTADDVEYLREHFKLLFTYSQLLDVYILCVTHWGTAWNYVEWITDIEQAARELGEYKR